MGFLDFIFKKPSTQVVSANDLTEELETAKQEATKPFNVFEQKKLVKQAAEAALKELNSLETIQPAASNRYSDVASELKKEYVERVRAALSPLLDLNGEYVYKAGQGIGEALKATAENQYFTQYYPEQCRAVASTTRQLEDAFRSLHAEEEKVEEKAAPYKHAIKKLWDYAETARELGEKTASFKEASERLDQLTENRDALSKKMNESPALADAKRGALQQKINSEKARACIKNALRPLVPAFSALAKLGVQEAKPFSLDAVNTLLEKGKPAYDSLLQALDQKTNEIGDAAVRALAHAKSVDGELLEALNDYSNAEAARNEAERNALPLTALENELNRTQTELNEAKQKTDSLSREMNSLVEKARRLKVEAEEAASIALKRTINVEHAEKS